LVAGEAAAPVLSNIKDVAREAGVSVTTVSHVVNGTRPVAPATQERVQKAISRLGYHPSGVARALKAQRTHTIGMIVTSSTNPFFAEVIRGVETACYDRGYSLILCNSGDVLDKLVGYLRALMMKRIDGLVVMTTNISQDFFHNLKTARRVPVVAIDTDPGHGAIDSVINDDSLLGGRLAGAYLAGRGFTRIACITGPRGHPRSEERLAGFAAALREAGRVLLPALSVPSDLTVGGGYRAMQTLLDLPPGAGPQAVFAFNDLLAMGALCAVNERRLRVPDDISIMGYDDIEYAAYTSSPLTTIRQPTFELGATAAEVLVAHLEQGVGIPHVLALKPTLCERRSVGRARDGEGGEP